MLRNDVTWLTACLSLGWKPADDDDAEDADAGDDADVRFRFILSGTKSKSSMADLRPPLAPQRNSMWLGHKRLAGSLIQHAILDGWEPGGCASWSLRWRLINIDKVRHVIGSTYHCH